MFRIEFRPGTYAAAEGQYVVDRPLGWCVIPVGEEVHQFFPHPTRRAALRQMHEWHACAHPNPLVRLYSRVMLLFAD